jgi:hypothetical protein
LSSPNNAFSALHSSQSINMALRFRHPSTIK